MKKLMIAASAALCATVGFGLESANIVGYQDYALVKGYNLYSPVFESLNETMDIQELKLKGEAVTGGGANFICLLDNDGVFQGSYGWWTPDDGTGADEGCWFDGDNWCMIEDTVAAGQGLYIYADDAGLKLELPCAIK